MQILWLVPVTDLNQTINLIKYLEFTVSMVQFKKLGPFALLMFVTKMGYL